MTAGAGRFPASHARVRRPRCFPPFTATTPNRIRTYHVQPLALASRAHSLCRASLGGDLRAAKLPARHGLVRVQQHQRGGSRSLTGHICASGLQDVSSSYRDAMRDTVLLQAAQLPGHRQKAGTTPTAFNLRVSRVAPNFPFCPGPPIRRRCGYHCTPRRALLQIGQLRNP